MSHTRRNHEPGNIPARTFSRYSRFGLPKTISINDKFPKVRSSKVKDDDDELPKEVDCVAVISRQPDWHPSTQINSTQLDSTLSLSTTYRNVFACTASEQAPQEGLLDAQPRVQRDAKDPNQ